MPTTEDIERRRLQILDALDDIGNKYAAGAIGWYWFVTKTDGSLRELRELNAVLGRDPRDRSRT